MEELKRYLSKFIRKFDYKSLKWHWDNLEWYPNGYGGDCQIQLQYESLEYLKRDPSGIAFFNYLDRKVKRLSKGRCYLSTNQGYCHSSLDIVAW